MNIKHLSAKYPIIGTNDYIEVYLGAPEALPPMTRDELQTQLLEEDQTISEVELDKWADDLAKHHDKKVRWTLTAGDYTEHGEVYGIDDLQATLLALKNVLVAIETWQEKIRKKFLKLKPSGNTLRKTP